jgi:glyoxylase-like metal-dependent hydrolase (beta-lactamase superfamily II)
MSLFANAKFVDKDYHFEKINKNLYIMHGPVEEPSEHNKGFMNNPGAIIGKKGVIIIDPGGSLFSGNLILTQLKKLTNKPIVAIFNTHVHGDHWLANMVLKNAYPKVQIFAHPNMIKRAKAGEAKKWINLIEKMTNGVAKGMIATYPNIETSDMLNIKIDSENFIIYSKQVKAHTNTDIMIEHVQSNVIFLGDNDFVGRFGNFDASSDMHGNIKALDFAISKKMTAYIPGHGQSGNIKDAVMPFYTYLVDLEKIVKKAYENDIESFEVKNIAIKALTRYKSWHGFNSHIGKHTSKMYNEIEILDM